MILKNRFLSGITALWLFLLFQPMALRGQEIRVEVPWQQAFAGSEESTFVPALRFAGAIHSDSMPAIPLYVHRKVLSLPHFSYQFEMEEIEKELCTAQEAEILGQMGFNEPDFRLISSHEISGGEHFSVAKVVPVRFVNGQYEKLVSFNLKSHLVFDTTLQYSPLHSYPEQSVLASGNWYRVCVKQDGIYRLTFQDLVSLGMDPAQISKSTLQLFGNGGGMLPEANADDRFTDLQENAIWISGSGSGNFSGDDYILFYGQSPHRWALDETRGVYRYQMHLYANETCYFITHSQNNGKRVEQFPSIADSPTHQVTDFLDYAVHQRELVNLVGSGKLWFGELFDVTLSREFTFTFPNLLTQFPVNVQLHTAARSPVASSFSVSASGQSGSIAMPGVSMGNSTGMFATDATRDFQFTVSGESIPLNLTYNRSSTSARGWLRFIQVNARRQLIMTGDQMFFRNPAIAGQGHVARFQLNGIASGSLIWDVTDPLNAGLQQFQLSGSTAAFSAPAEQVREYVVFRNQNYLRPELRGSVANQNLHGSQVHDLIIVVPDLFRPQAERLAEFRRIYDGLTVKLVSPQQIYNEFSSGVPDIAAIRNFMKMYYDRGHDTGAFPRYLLLFGSGTYDNRNRLGFGGNFIPTFQTRASLSPSSSFITDDFFGLLDDHEGLDAFGAIDLGIGRFPVRSVDEARFVVDKIIRYNQRVPGLQPGTDDPRFAGVVSNYADWRNIITLIADDEDSNTHFTQSEQIAGYMAAHQRVYNIEKIYLDAYEQVTLAGGSRYPEVNRAINSRVNQGALLINYIGHGGVLGLAHERILTFDDITSWGNFYNLPVFMTATCEFSSFDQPDPNELSAGVRIFLKPNGGAVALFTTTRLAWSGSNFSLNDAFMRNAFIPMDNGEMPRLGDLIRMSKVQSSSSDALKNFVLLGDPSMQMAYPRYTAVTTEVPDTIKALQQVTIRGEIHDPSGVKATSYNGVIYPTIYDKKGNFSTLGNDPGSTAAPFTMQNRILYRGKASIVNGEFEFSFIVPRDISYNTGFGKISYYFDDGEYADGNGYFDQFIVSGTASDFIPDHQGPEIALYLNNTGFRSGDRTGPDPILLAYLSDESGINTTGHIGHDIVAFLNDDTSRPIVLNNFYQANLNDFTSGRVVYPFFNLEKGEYTLTLRAWDVHNNVSIASIDFIVTAAPGIEISNLLNFPNPFRDNTEFIFSHNKPASELLVRIDIHSLNGQLVNTIEEKIYASGFDIPPIRWDGRDSGGTLLNTGIYVFRVFVTTDRGEQVHKSEKLIIMR